MNDPSTLVQKSFRLTPTPTSLDTFHVSEARESRGLSISFDLQKYYTWSLVSFSSVVEGSQATTMAKQNDPSFLGYPFEIRAMVYEEFFAAEFCVSSKPRRALGMCVLASDVLVFL